MARFGAAVVGVLTAMVAGCAGRPENVETASMRLAEHVECRVDARGQEPLFILRRSGGIAGVNQELKWYVKNNAEFAQAFEELLIQCQQDHYPAPRAMDTFNYQLDAGTRVIAWNELSADVPPVLRELEEWFVKF